jgi:arylformamidase
MMLHVDFNALYNVPAEQTFNLILVSGVFDLRPLVQTDINDNLKLDLKSATKFSPLLTSDTPIATGRRQNLKVFILYGENESPAFKQQSEDYAKVK